MFDGVKVFTATKARDREVLGDLVTDWLKSHKDKDIVDKVVAQSSDQSFHCLTITLFWKWRR